MSCIRWAVLAAPLAVMVLGCDRSSHPPAAAARVALPVVEPRVITPTEWRAALAAAYEAERLQDEGDGVTTFFACFARRSDAKCATTFSGKRDAFRKLWFFEPALSQWHRYGSPNYVHAYLSVKECELPKVLLNASYSSKRGWIFLNKMAVMADGDVVLEREVEHSHVERDNDSRGVTESATWVMEDAALPVLEKIAAAKDVSIRLSGGKGYVAVDAKLVRDMQGDFRSLLAAHKALTTVLTPNLPSSCP